MSLAFFDVDGTLLPLPSLEQRFFWSLVRRGQIPGSNYVRWLVEAARLGPRHVPAIAQANKAYLRGIPLTVFSCAPRTLPEFFPAALQRLWWHALRGDQIVLATGTLSELAHAVKNALERELRWRGVETKLATLATQLESKNGCSTGRVGGAPMFAREKVSAIARFAAAQNIPLSQCFAYGDHGLDRFMLAAVGHPFAVNPDGTLGGAARLHGWPVLYWKPCLWRTFSARNALQWKSEAAP